MVLRIVVENSEEELKSFPLTQSIRLFTSEVLEDSLLESKITLLRNIKDQILNQADLYNYNIGFVKEKFSTVPIKVFVDGNKVTIDPNEPLNPGSSYTLFIDKNLSGEYITLEKTVRKSDAQLELLLDNNTETKSVYRLQIISDPLITNKNNIVKIQLYVDDRKDRVFTVDAKSSKNTFTFYGYTVRVLDTAYGKDEEFQLSTSPRVRLEDNLVVNIDTVLNTEIRPAEHVSRAITEDDIREFNKEEPEEEKGIRVEYAGTNRVILHLSGMEVSQLDFKNMCILEFPAYNRYDLECMGLYDPKQKFSIDYKLIDDKTVLLEFKETT